MRNKTLFAKLVRYTCWISDLLLIGLAIYLSASNRDALSPLLMLTISVCILGGGLLPLLMYYFDFLFAQNEVKAEAQHGPESLRQSVIRLTELTERAETAIADATKATLIARQVPERIEEKTAFLEEVSTRMQPGLLDSMLATLSSMETRLYSLHADWEGLQRKLDRAESEASLEMASDTILRRLTEIEKEINGRLSSEGMWSRFADWSESLGGELASMRELIKTLSKEEPVVEVAGTATLDERPPETEEAQEESEPEGLAEVEANELWEEEDASTIEEVEPVMEAVEVELEPEEEEIVATIEEGAVGVEDGADEVIDESEIPAAVEEEVNEVAPAIEEVVMEAEAVKLTEPDYAVEADLESDWVDEGALSESEKAKADSFLDEDMELETELEEVEEEEVEESVAEIRDDEVLVTDAGIDAEGELESEKILEDVDELLGADELFPEEEMRPEVPKVVGVRRVEQAMFFDDMEEPRSAPMIDSEAIVIQAKVLVGIANRVFVRGEGGGLSWDEGTPLELTGIGEWRWSAEGVQAPVRCQLWLNDDRPAKGDAVELMPGEIHVLKPVF